MKSHGPSNLLVLTTYSSFYSECIAKSRSETLNAREEMRSKKESGYISKRIKVQLMKNLQLFRRVRPSAFIFQLSCLRALFSKLLMMYFRLDFHYQKLKDRMKEKKDSMAGIILRSVDIKTADLFLARFEGCIMSVDEAITVLSNPPKLSRSAILSDLPELAMLPMGNESSFRHIGEYGIHYDRGRQEMKPDDHVAPQRISKLHRTQVGAFPREVLRDKLSRENAISVGSEDTGDLHRDAASRRKSGAISRASRATGDLRGFSSAQLNDMAGCSGADMEGYDATESMLRHRNTRDKLRCYRTRQDVQKNLADKTDRRAENLLQRYIDMKETAQMMTSQSSDIRLAQGNIEGNMKHRMRVLDVEAAQVESLLKFNDDSMSTLSPRDFGPQTSTNPLIVTSTSSFSLKGVRSMHHSKSPSRGPPLSRGRVLSPPRDSQFQPVHLAVSDCYPNNTLGFWGSPQRRDDGRLVQGSSLNDSRTSFFSRPKPKPFFS